MLAGSHHSGALDSEGCLHLWGSSFTGTAHSAVPTALRPPSSSEPPPAAQSEAYQHHGLPAGYWKQVQYVCTIVLLLCLTCRAGWLGCDERPSAFLVRLEHHDIAHAWRLVCQHVLVVHQGMCCRIQFELDQAQTEMSHVGRAISTYHCHSTHMIIVAHQLCWQC